VASADVCGRYEANPSGEGGASCWRALIDCHNNLVRPVVREYAMRDRDYQNI
jgi:hypothetical protein